MFGGAEDKINLFANQPIGYGTRHELVPALL